MRLKVNKSRGLTSKLSAKKHDEDEDTTDLEGGDHSIVNTYMDHEALAELMECKSVVEFGHIRVKAWMLARAITLDLLVR